MNSANKTLKQALVAILIGVAITFITEALQAVLIWLQTYPVDTIGSTTGAVAFMVQKLRPPC